MPKSVIPFALALFLCSLLIMGCSGSNKNSLSSFQPEIINTADAFQFQITDAKNVSTTVSYDWTNTGSQASINHSTVTTSGSATVYLLDANNVEVYSAGLAASLNETSSTGATGIWTVKVVFENFSGTANFRVQTI